MDQDSKNDLFFTGLSAARLDAEMNKQVKADMLAAQTFWKELPNMKFGRIVPRFPSMGHFPKENIPVVALFGSPKNTEEFNNEDMYQVVYLEIKDGNPRWVWDTPDEDGEVISHSAPASSVLMWFYLPRITVDESSNQNNENSSREFSYSAVLIPEPILKRYRIEPYQHDDSDGSGSTFPKLDYKAVEDPSGDFVYFNDIPTDPDAMIAKLYDKRYAVIFPDLPGCATQGESLNEAVHMAEEALRCHLGGMLKDDDEIPVPTPEREILDLHLKYCEADGEDISKISTNGYVVTTITTVIPLKEIDLTEILADSKD